MKNQLIQIKTEKLQGEGLFDYSYNDIELVLLFQSDFGTILNYDEFVNKVIEILWKKTEDNLEIIRQMISGNMKTQVTNLITNLEIELAKYFSRTENPELFYNIATCRTNIQKVLEKIKEWFYRRTLESKDFDLDKVINTCIAITNNIYKNNEIKFKIKKIECYKSFKGEYFTHFIDLFRIFFDNIIIHSKQEQGKIVANLELIEENENLIVKITNILNYSKTEKKILIKKLNNLKNELASTLSETKITKQEGGSGFFKAKKILAYDLMNEESNFNFSINKLNSFEISFNLKINKLLA